MKFYLRKISTIVIILLSISSCGNGGCTDPNALNYSTLAVTDDGSCILPTQTLFEEEFTLTFGPNNSFSTYEPLFNYVQGDVIILEHLSDPTFNYWSPLPVVSTGVLLWGEYGDNNGDIYIYTDEVSTGNNYYWSTEVTLGFRAFLIKNSARKINPELEFMSIDEIKSTFL